MTDKQQWEEFLEKFNIPSLNRVYNATDELVVTANSSENVKGYCGFELVAAFDREGKFMHIGIWE